MWVGSLLNVAAGFGRIAKAKASIPFFVAHPKNLLDLLGEEDSLSGEDNGSSDLSGEDGGTERMLTLESTRLSLINENSHRARRDWGCNQIKSRSVVFRGGADSDHERIGLKVIRGTHQ